MSLLWKILTIVLLFDIVPTIHSQETNQNKSNWLPKILWTWWGTKIPDDAHNIKIYGNNHKLMSQGWEVRHLDDTNQQEWFRQVPDYNEVLHADYFKWTEPSKKSDLIRLIVIKHFGGVYLDYSMLLTEPLDWLLNVNETIMENKFGDSPDVVLLYNSYHGSKETIIDSETNNTVFFKPNYESFFVAAKPGAKFTQQWFDTYVAVRKQSYKKYGNASTTYALEILKQENIFAGKFDGDHFEQSICGSILLQRKQKQFDAEWEKDKSKPRKLAVRYYNIWPVDAGKTSYRVHQQVDYNNDEVMRLFLQQDVEVLKKRNQYPRGFIKFFKLTRNTIDKFWVKQQQAKSLPCPNNRYILENSLAYQSALINYPVKFYYNQVVKNRGDMCLPKKPQVIKPPISQIQKNVDLQNIKKQLNDGTTRLNENNAEILSIKTQIQQISKRINDNEVSKQKTKQYQTDISFLKTQIQTFGKQLTDGSASNKQFIQKQKIQTESLKKQLTTHSQNLQKSSNQMVNAKQDKIVHEKYEQQIQGLLQKIESLNKQSVLTKSSLEQITNQISQIKKQQQKQHNLKLKQEAIANKKQQVKQQLKQQIPNNLQSIMNDPKQLLYACLLISAIVAIILSLISICCSIKVDKRLKKNQINTTDHQLYSNKSNKFEY